MKVQTSEGKVTANIFWDSEGFLLVEFLKEVPQLIQSDKCRH